MKVYFVAITKNQGSTTWGIALSLKKILFLELKSGEPRWSMELRPIHIILFFATLTTTTLAGAMMFSISVKSLSFLWFLKGLWFSIPIIFILLCHEFGHILALRKHCVSSTFPYFIPAPTLIGTFGAVMKLRMPIKTSSALLEIGAAGPIFGFVAAIPITILGFALSKITDAQSTEGMLKLGSSVIFNFLQSIVMEGIPEGKDLWLHPLCFAGWLGFFITAMNLIPIGQTDGGHILFSIIGKTHRIVTLLSIAVLIIIGISQWYGWLIWALAAGIFGLRHPPVVEMDITRRKHKIIASLTLLLLIVTFIPKPIYIQ